MFPEFQRFVTWLRCRSPQATTHVHYANDLRCFFAWAGKGPEASDNCQRYVLLSPSLWWDKGALFEFERQYALASTGLDARVFLSVGELESERMIANVQLLDETLRSRDYEGLLHRPEGALRCADRGLDRLASVGNASKAGLEL